MGVCQSSEGKNHRPFGIFKIILPNERWCTGNGTVLVWREFQPQAVVAARSAGRRPGGDARPIDLQIAAMSHLTRQ
jgi:hypothetical protein